MYTILWIIIYYYYSLRRIFYVYNMKYKLRYKELFVLEYMTTFS